MARFAVFKVKRTYAVDTRVLVNFTTVPGTAVEGEDYTPLSGILVFEPGETEKFVQVEVRSTSTENPESFTLKISAPIKATISRDEGVATLPAGANGLEQFLVNRELGVLFYAGEEHPGEGPAKDDFHWTLAATAATLDNEDGTPGTTPFPGYYGQLHYAAAPPTMVIRAGGGAIETLSGWWLHTLIALSDPGGPGVFQILFGNSATIPADQSLDPATAAQFNTWWNDNYQSLLLTLTDPDGVVRGSQTLPAADASGTDTTFKGVPFMSVPMTDQTVLEGWKIDIFISEV